MCKNPASPHAGWSVSQCVSTPHPIVDGVAPAYASHGVRIWPYWHCAGSAFSIFMARSLYATSNCAVDGRILIHDAVDVLIERCKSAVGCWIYGSRSMETPLAFMSYETGY